MLSMQVDQVVNRMVRALLIGEAGGALDPIDGGRDSQALYIKLDCRLSYGEEYSAARGLHLLYHLSRGYSYVDVFSSVTESCFAKLKDVREWTHECSHDECWKTIRIFSKVYFDMAREINECLVRDGFPDVAPADMSEYNSFPLFGPMFQWVGAEVSKDNSEITRYRKTITLTQKSLTQTKRLL